MGRTTAQHAGLLLRWRTVAAFLLVLLFGLQVAPLAQAQASRALDCCMAAEGKGCSMHLHRAAQTQHAGHTVAAVQAPCPCPPLLPGGAAGHGAVSLSASPLQFALVTARAASAQSRSLQCAGAAGRTGTRGPPVLTLAA